MKESKSKLTIGLFIIYLIALIWIVLLKMQFNVFDLPEIRSINLIPFKGSVILNGQISIMEIIDNLFIFIPLGIYINMFNLKWQLAKKTTIIAGISLLLEASQFIFSIGASDITDIIMNTLGGIIGIGIYNIILKFFKEKTNKIINIIALILTVLVLLLIGILLLVNFNNQ